jgi:hypothetical protein
MPGWGGSSTVLLRRWAEKARELLAAADRLQVGEGQIGAILAHARPDAGGAGSPEPHTEAPLEEGCVGRLAVHPSDPDLFYL